MSLKCLFGHKWNGCKCVKCGAMRDEGHNWLIVKDKCAEKCSICGKERSIEHKWNGCKCERCGLTRDEGHNWLIVEGKCIEKCSICGKERSVEHKWKSVEGKKKCLQCGIETIPKHYVAIAISNCTDVDTERIQRLNDMLLGEYQNDPAFSKLYHQKWQYVEKVLTHPTPEFNVMRVALDWIAEQVGVPSTKLVEENGKKLFVIKTPVPIGPSLWAVAHYFCE